MKSQYFVIKNLNGEKRFVEVDEELTAEEFMAYFSLYVKEAYPITEDEYKKCTKNALGINNPLL